MLTYFLYNSTLLICFAFSYIAEKGNTERLRFGARCVVFLALVLPAALRYETGTDYGNYVNLFTRMNTTTDIEVGWKYLNLLVKNCGLSVQWIFFITAVLIYYPICFIVEKKHFCITIILYILFGFYFKSYNGLRQLIAVSFVLWAVVDLERKKYIQSIILLSIGYLFHISVLFVLPCLLVSKIRIKGRFLPFVILFSGILLILKLNVLEIAFNLLAVVGHDFARYAGTWFGDRMEIGTGLGIFLRLALVILACLVYRKIIHVYPQKKIVLNLTIIYIWTYFLAAQFIILGRLRDLFTFVPLLVCGYAVEMSGKYKQIVKVGYFVLLLVLFEYDIVRQTRDTFSNSIYPYYSIFYQGAIE